MGNIGLLGTIAALYLAAAALPGPNTMLILHHAAAGRRLTAFAVVAGICTGSVLWVGLSLFGFGVVLQQLGWSTRRCGSWVASIWYGSGFGCLRDLVSHRRKRGHRRWLPMLPARIAWVC